MHNPDASVKRERASLFIYLPLTLFALYILYLFVTIPYRMGRQEGLVIAPYKKPVDPNEGKQAEVFDHRKLIVPTEQLIVDGEKVYTANCASCHGADGRGNGTAGQKLAVKPRNYHAPDAEWKVGTSVIAMYQTLDKGVGTMPAFPALNPRQRYAVIHYIHHAFMKERGYAEPTEQEIASLPAAGGAEKLELNPYAETRIPVQLAMQKLLQQGGYQPEAPAPASGEEATAEAQ